MKVGVLMAAAALMLTSGAEVVLEPGRVEVVIEKKAKKPVAYAAEELTNFLSRALGAAVPVRTRERSKKAEVCAGRTVEIVLGETAAAKAAGIDVSEKPRDTFVIKTAGNRVFIVGRDGGAIRGASSGTASARRCTASMRSSRTTSAAGSTSRASLARSPRASRR